MWIKKKDYDYLHNKIEELKLWEQFHERHNQMMLQQVVILRKEINRMNDLKKAKTENSKEKVESFNEATKPLMEWLEKNCNPHHVAIVDSMGAQLMSGEIGVPSPLAIKYREENNDLVK